jgi:hypothetical protein
VSYRNPPHWDWYDKPGTPAMLGHNLRDDGKPKGKTAAILWVPDPEARRGWREFYVEAPAEAPLPKRLGL